MEWISADVLCPFYYESGGLEVQCEGFVPGTTVTFSFRTKRERNDFMGKKCCGAYEECPFYMITEAIKYGEERG